MGVDYYRNAFGAGITAAAVACDVRARGGRVFALVWEGEHVLADLEIR